MSEQQPEAVEPEVIEGQEAIEVDESAESQEHEEHEEPGVAGDPNHGLPGDAEEMPEGDAEVQE